MTKKISFPIKIHGSKHHIANWILEHFPKNYEELDFVELLGDDGSVVFNKLPSKSELINIEDYNLFCLFASTRDEVKSLISKIKKKKITESNFKKLQETQFEDYLDTASIEFLLRKCSRGGSKRFFLENKLETLDEDCEELKRIQEKLKSTFLYKNSYREVLKGFNELNTFCYVNCSTVDYWKEEEHIELANILKNFKGKVLVANETSTFYKKMYKPFKRTEKKLSSGNESLWTNY